MRQSWLRRWRALVPAVFAICLPYGAAMAQSAPDPAPVRRVLCERGSADVTPGEDLADNLHHLLPGDRDRGPLGGLAAGSVRCSQSRWGYAPDRASS